MSFTEKLEALGLPHEISATLGEFYSTYVQAVRNNGYNPGTLEPLLESFLDLVAAQLADPYRFELYHEKITEPFDYYRFGMEFLRPLIDLEHSKFFGENALEQLRLQVERGENAILLANHQTEPDPQVISLLLESKYPRLAEEVISVAGQRVLTDPLAVPFSLGRNLLSIFSKKYIETSPEEKERKLLHNQRTMRKLGELLNEGGKCIYVAPSGGRDRPNATGEVEVAPFDPESVELFRLVARRAKTPTHFYPLALGTYALLPPPTGVHHTLGEAREARSTPVYMALGKEVKLDAIPVPEGKQQQREARANFLWKNVVDLYAAFAKK